MGNEIENTGKILIYQNEKGDTRIDVYFESDTIWMTQKAMCELYQVAKSSVSEHISNIFKDGELEPEATVRKFRTVQIEGTRQVTRERDYYNLDMILAVGYRVRSNVGIHFRRWASGVLTEYMKKGFALNDERLRNPREFGADASKDNMGLTSFKGVKVRRGDVTVAKNYMTHEEISTLNLIVNMYLDYAELQAKGHNPMHMADWESKLGDFLRFNGREVLENFGTVKREVAEKLALEQYEQYDANRRVLEAVDDVDKLAADVKRLKP